HPQTNGLTERFIKTLYSTLAKLVGDYKTTWDTILPAALFAYHTLPNYTIKYDPFFLTYGQYANLLIDLQLQKEEMPEELLEQSLELHIRKITEQLHQQSLQAQKNIQEAQQKQKEYHNDGIKAIEFKIGDQVLLYESTKKKVHGDKLREKWKGPYFVHDY
ncbi:14718_t:CDS:1, partial [Gigaspora rosea]